MERKINKGSKLKLIRIDYDVRKAVGEEFIEDIRVKYNDKKVLVVAHSAVLRGAHYLINGVPEDGDMSKIEIPNLRIIEYEI